jgi:hypothetical protein
MALHNFLNDKQKEIGICLEEVLDNMTKMVIAKNNKIQSLIRQNENLNAILQEKSIKQKKTIAIPQKNNMGKYLKEVKKINNLLSFILKKQILARQDSENQIKNGQFEAFKVVVNELENKKNKIGEQETIIDELQQNKNVLETKLQIANSLLEDVKRENGILLDKNNQLVKNLENKTAENEMLKEQNKDFDLLKTKYGVAEGVVSQLKNVVEQNNRLMQEQKNEIETIKAELKIKNINVMELKGIFVEILDEFNDILQRVNQDEWR